MPRNRGKKKAAAATPDPQAVSQTPYKPDKRLMARLSRLENSNKEMEMTHHMQHIGEDGVTFASATTAPFAHLSEGGKVPVRMPDPGNQRTAGAVIEGSFQITATSTVLITLCPNSADNVLADAWTVAGAPSADFTARAYSTADAKWTNVKADFAASKPYRIVAGGLRVRIAGSENPTGILRALETNISAHDTVTYRSQDEVLAGATRLGEAFGAKNGIMTRKLFQTEFRDLPVMQSATTLSEDRLCVAATGLTATDVVVVDYVLFVEYRTVLASVVQPTPSPVDFHWNLLQIIASDQSDIDHTADSLQSLASRIHEFVTNPAVRKAAKYASAAGTGALAGLGAGPGAAAAGAVSAVGPMLIDDLVRMLNVK